MREPFGDEPPEDRATSSSANDQPNNKEGEIEDTHRGESKWAMQHRLREGRRTAWSRWDVLGDKIHLPQEEIDKQNKSLQKNFHAEWPELHRTVSSMTSGRRSKRRRRRDGGSRSVRGKHRSHHPNYYLGSQFYDHWGRPVTLCLRKRWSDCRRKSSRPNRTQDMKKSQGAQPTVVDLLNLG